MGVEGMNRKGFIFSIDGLFAILLIIILGELFIAYYSVEEGRSQAFESAEAAASDAAIVGFYLNKGVGDFAGLSEGIPTGSEIGKCSVKYVYSYDGSSQGSIEENKFCKGIA